MATPAEAAVQPVASSETPNYAAVILVIGGLVVGALYYLLSTYVVKEPHAGAVAAVAVTAVAADDDVLTGPPRIYKSNARCGDATDASGATVARVAFSATGIADCFARCRAVPGGSPQACARISFYGGTAAAMKYHGANCVGNLRGCVTNHEPVTHTDGDGKTWSVYEATAA